MNHLQYTSKEMISATELVRKSKKVFNSVQKGEIDKAVILRDGKPSFILIDFNKYEQIMSEYLSLKENKISKKVKYTDELEDKKVEKALKDITQLSIEDKEEKKELNDFWE